MKALSIRQPWAWLICRPDLTDRPSLPTANPSASGALPLARPTGEGQGEGSFPPSTRAAALAAGELKTIENRDWPTKFRGLFLVHAAKTMTRADYDACDIFIRGFTNIELPPFHALDRGGIVGASTLVDCVDHHCNWWFTGAYGFLLHASQPLPFTACKGALGFFTVPAAIAAQYQSFLPSV